MSKKTAATESPALATPMTKGQSLSVPMAKIVVDWKRNSRKFKSESQIASIADSFKKQGQITPVRLSPRNDGKFDLVSGFTRYEAAKKLGWEAIDATVSTHVLTDGQRLIENVVENEVRKDLTPYEQAYAYADLANATDEKGKALTQSAIADIAGKSQSYVSRLIQATELLAPKILEQWRKDCEAMANGDDKHTPLVTVQDIKSLVKFDHAAQLAWLDEKIHGPEETDEEGDEDGDDEDKPDTNPRTSLANVKRALVAAEKARKESTNAKDLEYFDGVIAALKFAIKDGRSIPKVCKIKEGKVVSMDGESIAAPRSPKPSAQASA